MTEVQYCQKTFPRYKVLFFHKQVIFQQKMGYISPISLLEKMKTYGKIFLHGGDDDASTLNVVLICEV